MRRNAPWTGLYSRGARRPSWRRRGRVPACMNLEAGDEGGRVESLTGQRRPREHGEDDDGDEQSQTEHCALVGVRRQVSVRGFTERERGQEDGDDAVKLLDMLTRAKPTRGGAADAQTVTGRGHLTQSTCTVVPLTRSPHALAGSEGEGLDHVV